MLPIRGNARLQNLGAPHSIECHVGSLHSREFAWSLCRIALAGGERRVGGRSHDVPALLHHGVICSLHLVVSHHGLVLECASLHRLTPRGIVLHRHPRRVLHGCLNLLYGRQGDGIRVGLRRHRKRRWLLLYGFLAQIDTIHPVVVAADPAALRLNSKRNYNGTVLQVNDKLLPLLAGAHAAHWGGAVQRVLVLASILHRRSTGYARTADVLVAAAHKAALSRMVSLEHHVSANGDMVCDFVEVAPASLRHDLALL